MTEPRGGSVMVARSLFQGTGGGSIPTSPLQLLLEVIDFNEARKLNRLWHSRLPRFGIGAVKTMPYLCFGAAFDGIYYGAAIWSNPVARLLPQRTWLELRRLAIAPGAPQNTASRLLAIMVRIIRNIRPNVVNLISYQDTDAHTGTIYRAAGWIPTAISEGGHWTRPMCGRNRPKPQSESPKQRWEKCLGRNTEATTAGDGGTEPAGEVPGVYLPERSNTPTRKGDALSRPSLWDTSAEG